MPVTSAALSDAMRRLHPHAHTVLDLVTPTPGRVVSGPAATLLFAPVRADVPKEAQDFERHVRQALEGLPEGAVLVCVAPDAEHAAVVGGVRVALLEALGVGGLVTTARVRDFAELAAFPLPVYCRGETPMAGSAQIMPVASNIPVSLGGATVLPGDHVHVDESGAVVVPAKDAARAVALAEEIERDDAARVAKARAAKRD